MVLPRNWRNKGIQDARLTVASQKGCNEGGDKEVYFLEDLSELVGSFSTGSTSN